MVEKGYIRLRGIEQYAVAIEYQQARFLYKRVEVVSRHAISSLAKAHFRDIYHIFQKNKYSFSIGMGFSLQVSVFSV